MTIEFSLGNTDGQYFTQSRFDLLKELAIHLDEIGVTIDEPHLFYDPQADFHHLTFSSNGHSVDVRLYKVFSSFVDQQELWIGCQRSSMFPFAMSIKRKVFESVVSVAAPDGEGT